MSLSILDKIAEKLTFCKKCNMVCCVKIGATEDSSSSGSHTHHKRTNSKQTRNSRNRHNRDSHTDIQYSHNRDSHTGVQYSHNRDSHTGVQYSHNREISFQNDAPINRSLSNISDIDEFFNFSQNYIIFSNRITADFYVNEDLGKFMTDIDGYCLYINNKGAEHIGEDQFNLHYEILWLQNLLNEDFKKVSSVWQTALENETPVLYTTRLIVNNHMRYLVIEAYPVFSGNRCKGLRGVILRVTKQVWNKFTKYLQEHKPTTLLQ